MYRKKHFKWPKPKREGFLLSHKAAERKRTAHIPLGRRLGTAWEGRRYRI